MSGVRGLDLFPATGSGFLLSGLRRRKVGERRIRFRGHLRGYWPLRRRGLGGCSSRGRRRSCAWFNLEFHGTCSPGDIDNIVIQAGTSRIFKRLKGNLQCRLLLGSLLHPPGPSGDARCGWRGLVGRWRGPRHGDCHHRGGRGARLHPFGFSPGRRSRETARGRCQYSASWKLCNWPKQQFRTWGTRLLGPCVCTPGAGPSAPVVERRPTPRSGRRSCPGARLRAHALGGLAAALNHSKASHLGGSGGSRAWTSLGSFPRWRVHAFSGLVAALSHSKASLLGCRGCRRKEVIRSGEVRLRRVAAVQLRVSLQEVLQFSTGAVADFFSERSRILTGGGGFCGEYKVGTYGTVFTSSSTR
jgi:hypothetical protein